MECKIVIRDITIGERKGWAGEWVHVKYKGSSSDYPNWENDWYWKLEDFKDGVDPELRIMAQGYALFKQNRDEHMKLINQDKEKDALKKKLLAMKGREVSDVEKLARELES